MIKSVIALLAMCSILSIACAQQGYELAASGKLTNQLVLGNAQLDSYVPFLRGKRVALVANHTSTIGGTHLCDTLRHLGIDVVCVFCPEHGFRGTADAGEIISDSHDDGLRIVSLYGSSKKPTPEQMKDIDVVLYDLQDVGARFYTYISTMHLMMEACAEAQAAFVVLDRPNPHGSLTAGPVLRHAQKSFVGMHPIPILYGLTCGELACMISGEGWLTSSQPCNLKIVTMEGYNPDQRHAITCSPSPNLRSPEAIWHYPSLCLFEGTHISIGRGTSDPFTMIGAPLKSFGDFCFTPQPNTGASAPMYNGLQCYGEKLAADQYCGFGVDYLVKYYALMGDEDFWDNERFFDLLAGNDVLRQQIKSGISADSIHATWQADLLNYEAIRQKYLLYSEKYKGGDKVADVRPINWTAAMHSHLVDSLMNELSTDEKIAQLIWVTLNADASQNDKDKVLRTCAQHKVGGVLIMRSTIGEAHQFIAQAQQEANVPLLFAIDGENGIGRRLTNAVTFPQNISLGAITDTTLIRRAGQAMAWQMKAVGFDVNFAPVADVNTNPKNPIIGVRAFGSQPSNVAEKATAIALGMQDGGCVAVLKHFPGHGDTSTDSHKTLPVVRNSLSHLQQTDLVPFARALGRGVMGVMSAHIAVPALDDTERAASLSPLILKDLLRKEIGFEGLVITDAMNMAGIKISAGKKNAEAQAIAAGNDVAEFSLDAEKAIAAVHHDLQSGAIDSLELWAKVRRVLAVKEWCGAMAPQHSFGAPDVLVNSIDNEILIDSLYQASVTLFSDSDSVFAQAQKPRYFALGEWSDRRLVSVGDQSPTSFASSVAGDSTVYLFCDDTSISRCNALLRVLSFGQNTVIVFVGNPYRLSEINYKRPHTAVVVAYERNARAKRALLRCVFDGEKPQGKFPLSQ